jgi:hypothetical protein
MKNQRNHHRNCMHTRSNRSATDRTNLQILIHILTCNLKNEGEVGSGRPRAGFSSLHRKVEGLRCPRWVTYSRAVWGGCGEFNDLRKDQASRGHPNSTSRTDQIGRIVRFCRDINLALSIVYFTAKWEIS